jgi:hypothetical protein
MNRLKKKKSVKNRNSQIESTQTKKFEESVNTTTPIRLVILAASGMKAQMDA